ncbi:ABC transporter permease [Candidatus Woesearchaeota archaeon]|nr:ABC transporter permease [Candidatus Woesearchaeota archaeon]
MIADYFKLSSQNLRKRGKRTFLTLIGIFIGIAAVVGLMALGQGLQNTIMSQLSVIGGDRITIQKSGSFGPPGSGTSQTDVTMDDVELIRRVKGVDGVAFMLLEADSAEFRGKKIYTLIQGIPEGEDRRILEGTTLLQTETGRFLRKGDKYKAVVGYRFNSEEIFDRKLVPGDKIKMLDHDFEIIGVRKSLGNPMFDGIILIPIDTLKEITGEKEKVSVIMAAAKKGEDINRVADRIEEAMRKDRGLEEGKENFQVSTSQDTLETFSTILLIVQGIIIGIAAISLIVGGIGIMNTMYTAVLERTNEIGIMKAIGARNSDIMLIFLIEAGLLGTVGGVIGVLIGVGLSKAVEIGAKIGLGPGILTADYPAFLIIGALLFSFLIGSLSGLLPARQASRMNPVDSLRYE